MRVLVIGPADDARGFALAGAATRRAEAAAEVEQALVEALAAAPPWGLVVLTVAPSGEAARRCAEAQARPGPPTVVVLGADGAGGHHGHAG